MRGGMCSRAQTWMKLSGRLSGDDVGGDLFAGERRKSGEAIIGCEVGFVCVDFGVLVGGFGRRTDRYLNIGEFLVVGCL